MEEGWADIAQGGIHRQNNEIEDKKVTDEGAYEEPKSPSYRSRKTPKEKENNHIF